METEPSSYPPHQWWLSLVLLFFLSPFLLQANSNQLLIDQQVDRIIEFAEEEVKERLQQLDQSLLEHRFDESVKRLIAYHLRNPKQTSRNLGRAIAYFPIFEAELAAAGVPESIKYLSVIESALLPRALSRVGAEGLWQFMPETAPEYGLRIDDYVDERLDAFLATRAAIRYLQSAHDYLGDWSLALAAYNSGKGRVRRAQRRSGGKNFWAVRRHLPRETRNYVPAFIAAIYLTEFYAVHDIEPLFPSLDRQLLEKIKVEVPLSFYRLSQVTGLSVDFIQQLNPSYLQGYLPAYEGGHYLLLPQRVVPALSTYLQQYGHLEDEPVLPWAPILKPIQVQEDETQYYRQYTTLLTEGDSLESIAHQLYFTPSQLAIWNNITPLDSLVIGQEIHYYRPIQYTYLTQRTYDISQWHVPWNPLPHQLQSNQDLTRSLPSNCSNRLHFTIANKEKPADFLVHYPQVSEEVFLRQNQLLSNKSIAAGTQVVLPRK